MLYKTKEIKTVGNYAYLWNGVSAIIGNPPPVSFAGHGTDVTASPAYFGTSL
jgi:hypothetical protein